MFRPRFLPIGVGALALGLVGCGSDSSGGGGAGGSGGGGGSGGSTQPTNRIDIVVDANRDGLAKPEDAADQERETEWDVEVGASFIANVDDDDLDGKPDADDEIVNGEGDKWDLATILVNSWPSVSAGAAGIVRIDAEAAENIHVFKYFPDGTSTLVLGSTGACTAPGDCTFILEHVLSADETKAGVTLGIEARRFKGQPMGSLGTDELKKNAWAGFVDLTYEVKSVDGQLLTTEANPDGVDRARMRVAPWLMLGSMAKHDALYSSVASAPFVNGNQAAADAAGVQYNTIPTSINTPKGWPDIWTEDFFQTGVTSFPGEIVDGVQIHHGIRVYNARPWGRPPVNNPSLEQRKEYAPIRWLNGNPEKNRPPAILGPDQGGVAFYNASHEGNGGTQDSHGNHDLVPPYEGMPNGRIIHGNKTYAETAAFYDNQLAQGPSIVLDTTWLAVEHVDEFFHWVPANTARGWKLLVADPALMTQMLEEMATAGNGAMVLHQGKGVFQKTVDETLADTELLTWSQTAQVKIDGHVEIMKAETGITDDDIILIPTWFEDLQVNEKVAWNPGMVNMRMLGDVASIAKPFGPLISGADPFETYIKEELGTPKHGLGSDGQGLKVYFTDDWYYHEALGEVHCGTNASSPPFQPWWVGIGSAP